MITRSFRVRLALLATGLAGLLLVAFGVAAGLLVYRAGVDRIDGEIRDQIQRHIVGPEGPRRWERVDTAVRWMIGDEGPGRLMLLVLDARGQVRYVSPNWPADLPYDELPFPSPPPPDAGPGPPPDSYLNEPPPPPPRDVAPGPGPGRLGPGPRPFRRPGGPGGPPPFAPPRFLTRTTADATWRIGATALPESRIAVGLNIDGFLREMVRIRNAFLAAVAIGLAFIALGSWFVATRALQPVRTLTGTMEGITARGLAQRIPEGDEAEEFRRLVAVFNAMLDRLERSFRQAVRFSADASHELKTPLAVMQGELEQALNSAQDESREQQTAGRLLDEVRHLTSIVEKLLLLSRADSGRLELASGRVDLTALLESLSEDCLLLAPDLRLDAGTQPDVTVAGDPELLPQAFRNLVDNARRYNRPEGHIGITLARDDDGIVCRIVNTGPGIAEEDRPRVFERFYRGDDARNRAVGGLGLGLSLAREIVVAHGGTLVLEDGSPDRTTFTVRLPGTS